MRRVNIGCYGKDLRTKKMQNLRMILNDNNLMFSYNTKIKMFDVIIENEQQNNLVVNLINTFRLDHELIKEEKQMISNLTITLKECDLVEDIESIEVQGNYISTDLGEYMVFNSYEDAELEAVEQCKQIIKDCGLTENLIFEAEIQGLINTEWFEDFWEETHEFMAYGDVIEYIASDEEMEQLENGDITEDEIRENYFNSLQDSIAGQALEEYKFQFGEKQFNDIIIKENLIDIDSLAEWCVDMDGVAHFIASYDGEEIEENGYYIYRVN